MAKHKNAFRTCLVTGASDGIGYATAANLAAHGHDVWLMCRNPSKGKAVQQELQVATHNENIHLLTTDLSSQKQIRATSRAMGRVLHHLDVLINNAGTWISKRILTEDGIEKVFAVNYLAPFLLTHELYPLLKCSEDARVINVSSDSHFHGTIRLNNLSLDKEYHGLRSYAQSKLGLVLFTKEFERRKPDSHVSIFSVQPGLVHTDIGLKHTTWLHQFAWKVRRGLWKSKRPEDGAATSSFLALHEESLSDKSGTYWDNCAIKPASKEANDPTVASRLWDRSLALCHIDDYFN